MPQFGPSLIDDEGVHLIYDWICSLDPEERGGSENVASRMVRQLHSPLSPDQADRVQVF